ncbi:ABC transporter substrate-binding protein [Sphaerotilus mobilis]|uniref:Iron complex transport system substrate-binding protein n=1 Tax=Sphaerotilus mobilis TaxID=47994 RepID=A0A4Q7LTL5_9BURK|nr:helical backbone metal receptor [Sphaerotilus mobilis]RZS58064.1 iron complex transport system substrate-binding protein [Sphaerotilus mobilis]
MTRAWALLLVLLSTLTQAQAAPSDAPVDPPPRRIVSLLPSITEAVCALDACDRLVGVDRYSNFPASIAGLPRLGGMDDAQLERIVALRPDLVLASPSTRVVDRLRVLGLRVVTLQAESHADVRHALERIAAVIGRPERADALWRAIEADLSASAQRVPAGWRGRRVYFEIATTPYAAGAASFIGETLARLGLRNIVDAGMGPFPQLNPEFILRAAPDLVMAAAQPLAEMPRRPGWGRLVALSSRQTCAFAAAPYDMLVRPGPRLGEAARLIADCLAALPPPR